MTIEITQAHIDAATKWQRNPGRMGMIVRNCPMALAAQEAFDNPEMTAGVGQVYGSHQRFDVPLRARNWQADWDRHQPVEPIAFEVVERGEPMI